MMCKRKKNLAKCIAVESFARQHGVDFFHDGRGIGHQIQILVEESYVRPYQRFRKPSPRGLDFLC